MNTNLNERTVLSTRRAPYDSALVTLRRPGWLPEKVWPYTSFAVQFEGTKIAITDVGDGPTLVFVHTGLWSMLWRNVIQRLAPDFRCICFDAPGTGQSDRLPVREITLAKAARALQAVVETLDLRDLILIVHDLGGPSGIAGAARVAERVRAICAVNTFAWKPTGLPFRFMLALMGSGPMREFTAWTGLLDKLTASPFGIGRTMDDASRQAFLAGIGRQGRRAFHSYIRDARRASQIYTEVDRALTGPFARLPLTTVFGERNDPFGFQPRWKALFPNARQAVVPGGNHFPMCDDPDLVASSIRELHRIARPPRKEMRA